MKKNNIFEHLDIVKLVPLSKGYRIEDFFCKEGYKYYEDFLKNEALRLSKLNVSKTHLLINKVNADIMAYMSILCSQIKLHITEKGEETPFNTYPVIKIGQLAIDKKYNDIYRNIGTLMIELVRGIADDMNSEEIGVACKFIVVDANVIDNPTVTEFYEKIGFKYNIKENERKNKNIISMRLELSN